MIFRINRDSLANQRQFRVFHPTMSQVHDQHPLFGAVTIDCRQATIAADTEVLKGTEWRADNLIERTSAQRQRAVASVDHDQRPWLVGLQRIIAGNLLTIERPDLIEGVDDLRRGVRAHV